MGFLLLLALVAVVVLVAGSVSRRKQQQALEQQRLADLESVRRVADEDVTRFGEELQQLDSDLLTEQLEAATRQDYQRALDSYESAKSSMERVTRAEDITHVTQALEDGRYAEACVRARVAHQPLPTRRPPCFFNPAHGPSTLDILWAPAGGRERQIPVCAADADRVEQGAEPDVRTVQRGVGRVPYWQGGAAYSPWASGYYGGYAASGLLPAFMIGTLLAPSWDGFGGGFDGGYDQGYESGYDQGYDQGSDGGSDGGGGDGGGDGGVSDYGGGDGGDFGGFGGSDFGGGDFGGGDFGGGDFGGGF